MDSRHKNNKEHPGVHEAANVLPATEIVENPNPRANENIRSKEDDTAQEKHDTSGVGSEITDGEDA
jgi:hypothetical protein